MFSSSNCNEKYISICNSPTYNKTDTHFQQATVWDLLVYINPILTVPVFCVAIACIPAICDDAALR